MLEYRPPGHLTVLNIASALRESAGAFLLIVYSRLRSGQIPAKRLCKSNLWTEWGLSPRPPDVQRADVPVADGFLAGGLGGDGFEGEGDFQAFRVDHRPPGRGVMRMRSSSTTAKCPAQSVRLSKAATATRATCDGDGAETRKRTMPLEVGSLERNANSPKSL